jgi:hypothetical protein
MKNFFAILLAAILAVLIFAALDQHENIKRHDRADAEKTLDECWAHATDHGGIGADVCKDLLNK